MVYGANFLNYSVVILSRFCDRYDRVKFNTFRNLTCCITHQFDLFTIQTCSGSILTFVQLEVEVEPCVG